MKQAQQTASPNTITTSTYFGALRIKKVVGPPGGPNTTTTYIYSGTKPIAEYVNGSLSKEYIYSGSTLLATVAGGATTYHHPDHLSNRVETDSSGAPVRSFGQLPYGEVWYEPTGADKLKFTSYERESASGGTGLDYAMFRHYSPGLARFMSADMLAGHRAAPQSLNRYAYAADPISNVDPLGLTIVNVCNWGVVASENTKFAGEDKGTTLTFGWLCQEIDFIEGGGGGGATPIPAPSNPGDSLKDNAAQRMLSSSDCLNFILDVLSKVFAARNQAYMNKHGHAPAGNTLGAQREMTSPMAFLGVLFGASTTISSTPDSRNPTAVAKVSDTGNQLTLFPRFFSPGNDREETLLHETFHMGRYDFSDQDIAAALGISFTDGLDASNKWDKELEKHCGKK